MIYNFFSVYTFYPIKINVYIWPHGGVPEYSSGLNLGLINFPIRYYTLNTV